MLSAASGFSRYSAASHSGKRNMISANTSPITKNVMRATRNVFSSCLMRPLASASATRRDSATGRPAVASVKKMKYMLYALVNIEYPSSPRMLPSGILYIKPSTFIIATPTVSITAPCI